MNTSTAMWRFACTFVQHKFAGKSFGCITNCLVCEAFSKNRLKSSAEWWRITFTMAMIVALHQCVGCVCVRACMYVFVCRLVSLFRVNHICICKNFNLVLVNVCTILWIYSKKVLFNGVPRVYNRWHQRVPLLTLFALVCTDRYIFGKCFKA